MYIPLVSVVVPRLCTWPLHDPCKGQAVMMAESCTPQLLLLLLLSGPELTLEQARMKNETEFKWQEGIYVLSRRSHRVLKATIKKTLLIHTFGLSVLGSLSTFSMAVRASNPPTTLQKQKNILSLLTMTT